MRNDGRKYRGAEVPQRRVILTREEAMRVDRFVVRCGKRQIAATRLGVGYDTVAIASSFGGALLRETYEKLFAALDRIEREEGRAA